MHTKNMIALISESVAFGSELRAPLPPDFNVGYEGITISWYCAKSGTTHPAGINIAYTKLNPQPRRSLQTRNIEITLFRFVQVVGSVFKFLRRAIRSGGARGCRVQVVPLIFL